MNELKRSLTIGLLALLMASGRIYAQDSINYHRFISTSLGFGYAFSGSVSGFSGNNVGFNVAFPYGKISLQADASLTSATNGNSLYNLNSASANIGKVIGNKRFMAAAYIGPAYMWGTTTDGDLFRTAGININIPLMIHLDGQFFLGVAGYANYGIGYNSYGVRATLMVGGNFIKQTGVNN